MTQDLATRLYERCRLVGEFTLRSGQVSDQYFDKYLFEADPVLLREVAEALVALLPGCDVLAGVEMGGIPIAAVMSQLTGLPAAYVRKEAKEYGTCKAVEGADVSGRRVVLVEDTVTTAGALVAACGQLRSLGASVQVALCAINRGTDGVPNLASVGVELRSPVDAEMLATAARSLDSR
ncbi:MAG TPA: orotate phosphoribosyltransferase [Acidimicrobiales bacterium]|nr:orotate phosphoribosyltransferase [Acidimicrobiales bacterium]